MRRCLERSAFEKRNKQTKPRRAGGRLRLRESQVEQIRLGGRRAMPPRGCSRNRSRELNWEMMEEVTKILLPVARKKPF